MQTSAKRHSRSSGSRPYSLGAFQKMLNDFEKLIKEITFQDVQATPEERRQMITGKFQIKEIAF